MTAVLLQHMLWEVPEQKEAIRKLILDRVVSGGTDTGKLKLDVFDLKNSIYNCPQQELPDLIACNKCYEEERKTTGWYEKLTIFRDEDSEEPYI